MTWITSLDTCNTSYVVSRDQLFGTKFAQLVPLLRWWYLHFTQLPQHYGVGFNSMCFGHLSEFTHTQSPHTCVSRRHRMADCSTTSALRSFIALVPIPLAFGLGSFQCQHVGQLFPLQHCCSTHPQFAVPACWAALPLQHAWHGLSFPFRSDLARAKMVTFHQFMHVTLW